MVVRLVFEGDFACFTRPEFVAERVSYDLPPPTAARGMIEAIYWKPEIAYRIASVSVLPHSSGRPTRFMRMTTNEVKEVRPCDVSAERTQRRNLFLRDAAFLIEAEILRGAVPGSKCGHDLGTHAEILTRRIQLGQFRESPALGLRDFPARFRLATSNDVPLNETRPLGPMTYIVWDRSNYATGRAVRRRVTMPSVLLDSGSVNMRGWTQ